jgi:MEMO1 family protein
VEIQLPWLQYAAPEARLLPVYVGRMTEAERKTAARALAELADEDTAWLASSDLIHFGREFGYEPAESVAELDRAATEDAGSLDAGLFLDGLEASGATVCGRAPIALRLDILREWERVEIFQEVLDYRTSGEITGDCGHSVSYGALGYFPATSFELAAADGACLMQRARAALARLGGGPAEAAEVTPALARCAGAFVTLRQGGALRGCVGSAGGTGTLAQAVAEKVISAAVNDPRFPPLSPSAVFRAQVIR